MSRLVFAPCSVVLSLTMALLCQVARTGTAEAAEPYARIGARTQAPPSGWIQFCQTYAKECDTQPLQPRAIVLNEQSLNNLKRVNDWVNHKIKRKRSSAALLIRA